MRLLPSIIIIMAAVFFSSAVTAQISDSLYNALPLNAKPADKNHLTSTEKQQIVSLEAVNLPKHRAELTAMAATLIKEAVLTKNLQTKINNLNAVANYYSLFSHDTAIIYSKKILLLYNGDKQFDAKAAFEHLFVSEMYFYGDKYDSAIQSLHSALQLAIQLKETALMVKVYDMYSAIYARLGYYEKAIYYETLLMQLYPGAQKWDVDYIRYAINTASHYCSFFGKTGTHAYSDSAVKLVNSVLGHEKSNAANWYQACYYLLGYLDYKNNNYTHAIAMFDSCLQPAYNKVSMYTSNYYYKDYLYKAACLIKLGRYLQGQKILKGLKIGAANYAAKQVFYQALSTAAEAMGNKDEALCYFKKFNAASDSLNIQGQRDLVFEAEQKYQAAQEKANIAVLENRNMQAIATRNKVVVAAIVAVLLSGVVLYMRNSQQRLQRALALANQRRAISANMHDEVSSSLATLRYLITDLKIKAASTETKAVLQDLEEEARQVYIQSRNFVHQINNEDVQENYNVTALLQKLALRYDAEGDNTLQVHIQACEDDIEEYFTPLQHAEMYRVIQEAVANSMKHSRATEINIVIHKQANMFYFEITDNGVGANIQAAQAGMGLRTIKKRLALLNGKVSITGSNMGTIVSGSFPQAATIKHSKM